jgi:hypothetical protein
MLTPDPLAAPSPSFLFGPSPSIALSFPAKEKAAPRGAAWKGRPLASPIVMPALIRHPPFLFLSG